MNKFRDLVDEIATMHYGASIVDLDDDWFDGAQDLLDEARAEVHAWQTNHEHATVKVHPRSTERPSSARQVDANHTDGIPVPPEPSAATGDPLQQRLRDHGVDAFTLNLHADGERITQATITIDLGPRACSAPAWPTLAHTIATTICDHLDDP